MGSKELTTELERYFEKVIEDSYKAENREYEDWRENCFFIVVEDQFLYRLDIKYKRVQRRTAFRIDNNIEKNFGLKPFGYIDIEYNLAAMYVRNRIFVNDKEAYIIDHNAPYLNEIAEGKLRKYTSLCEAHFGISHEEYMKNEVMYDLPRNLSWEEFREAYIKAFQCEPEVEVEAHSSNVRLG